MALQLSGHEARIDHRTLEAQGIDREPTTHLGPRIAAMERKGVHTERGSRSRAIIARAQQHVPTPAVPENEPVAKPAPVPTLEECQAELLAIAKQGEPKMEWYYQKQIKPYLDYYAEADNKAEAFTFCRERMQEDITTGAPRLEEMRRELDERLRRFGGTGSQQIALRDEALDHIRLAPDREQAFAEVVMGMDMALERSRGLGR